MCACYFHAFAHDTVEIADRIVAGRLRLLAHRRAFDVWRNTEYENCAHCNFRYSRYGQVNHVDDLPADTPCHPAGG